MRSWFMLAAIAMAMARCHAAAAADDDLDLSVLGRNSWRRFRPAWSLTVNDQCLYEFAFEFQHDPNLPLGKLEFSGMCGLRDTAVYEEDGLPYLTPRPHWERFPNYVWAATGFQHLSVDWLACGQRPTGWAAPHYSLYFSRQTPEMRASQMNCSLTLAEGQALHVGERFCDGGPEGQSTIQGKRFYVSPANVAHERRHAHSNLPLGFATRRAEPYRGLWHWNDRHIHENPDDWTSLPLSMATYDGSVAGWNVRIPHKRIAGPVDKFTSNAARYHFQTMDTLPDTWSAHYAVEGDDPDDFFANKDEDNDDNNDRSIGKVVYRMVGKSGLCREDFEAAQAAAGGAPTFPNYDEEADGVDDYTPVNVESNAGTPRPKNEPNATSGGGDVDGEGEGGDGSNGGSGVISLTSSSSALVALMFTAVWMAL